MKEEDAHAFHEWIKYDLQYVDEQSMWMDIKIILATITKMLSVAKGLILKHPKKKWAPALPAALQRRDFS